jgi:Family of unknown function (DUF6428)
MTVDELLAVLSDNAGATLHLALPDGGFVPAHFHVTEAGRVQKDFIDCGGTVRSTVACVLQVWVADDTDHRLNAGKLAKIVWLAAPVLKATNLPVEIEYEAGLVSQFPLIAAEVNPSGVLFHLGSKQTACLAADRCGIAPPVASGCCATPGCC